MYYVTLEIHALFTLPRDMKNKHLKLSEELKLSEVKIIELKLSEEKRDKKQRDIKRERKSNTLVCYFFFFHLEGS